MTDSPYFLAKTVWKSHGAVRFFLYFLAKTVWLKLKFGTDKRHAPIVYDPGTTRCQPQVDDPIKKIGLLAPSHRGTDSVCSLSTENVFSPFIFKTGI